MSLGRLLKNVTRSYAPPTGAQYVRKLLTYWRYWRQKRRSRVGYRRYGEKYPYNLLFVAGLPKSGTSWMESMLSSYPGFHYTMIPEAVAYEVETGGSHDYDLPADLASRFEESLTVLKLHAPGSSHNVEVLEREEIPYLVMYRDLRDVAVSHYFYVRRTPWHPEYSEYKELSVTEGLRHFGETLLPEFGHWISTWNANRNSKLSLALRYEDLLDDTKAHFRRVASHFGLDDAKESVREIVDAHRFENVTGGRSRGEQDAESFARKGVAGDWRSHFTDDLRRLYKKEIGDLLIDLGYEEGTNW
ncbi:sulfotransferase domain-containing protein [Salinibacter ruber]|uniref:sulfotransferase domain-containing protein n=1 Tax=Salinibacter ruber TaxID=146919 RepID=UPI00216A66E9|nr:sulfotransferase domain-containing protein [Salinibacter ruber]